MRSPLLQQRAKSGGGNGPVIAVGAVVLLVAVAAAMAAGGGGGSSSTPTGGSGGFGGALAGGIKSSDGTGLIVSIGCHTTVVDLAQAKTRAYQLGQAGPTLAEAQAKLFQYGACGVTQELKPDPPRENARNLYLVWRELWRGAVQGGHLQDFVAKNLMRAALIGLALQGVPTGDLPSTL